MNLKEYTIKTLEQYQKSKLSIVAKKADNLTALEKHLIKKMYVFYITLNA